MTIKREELDRQEVDFSDVTSGRRLPRTVLDATILD